MNKNVLIVLAGAVLVAVLVAVMVQVMIGGKDEAPVQQEAKVNVIVAAKDLQIGQELKPGDLRWQPWPKSSLFPGAVRQLEGQSPSKALEGRLARDIAKGEPVMKTALLGVSKGNFVAASLEPGMRAMSIDVKAASMVSGFIGPGDFVDVILTYGIKVKSDDDEAPAVKRMLELSLDDMATETILQNVKVLAVDQSAQRPEDDKVKVGKTVTLAVDARNSERLTLAAEMGQLHLVLRAVGDDAVVEKKWPTVSDARLTSIKKEIFDDYDRMKEESGGASNTVRVYNGNAVQAVSTR